MRKNDKKPPLKQSEQESVAQIKYLENLDLINQAMQTTNDLEQVMEEVLDTLLTVFNCDRAWLVYPCDPDATTWQAPIEGTRPEYPGVSPFGVELPLEPARAAVFRILREATGPVKFGPKFEHQIPVEIAQALSVQSFIAIALYPKTGMPWAVELQQCSYARVWSLEEEKLFQEVGRRLSITLTNLLAYRDLRESEQKSRNFVEESSDGFTLVNEQGQIIKWNRAREKMTGLTADQVKGRYLWEVMRQIMPPERRTPENYARNKKSILEALETGQSPIFNRVLDAEVMRQDGEHQFHQQTIFPIKTDQGYQIGSITRDITERKQAEDQLQQNRKATLKFSEQLAILQDVTNSLSKADSSEDLCRLAVQLGNSRLGFDRVSIWFIDEHLNILRGSFGTDEHGELRDERNALVEFKHEGLGWHLYSNKEPMALVEHGSLSNHLREEVGEGDNAIAALWDGDEVIGLICVDNLFSGKPIEEHQLEVLRLYATTLGHLITRKRAEEALRSSEEQLQLALDAAEMGQWEWKIATGEVLWSPQCLALYGLPPNISMSYERFLQALHPEDRESVAAALRRAVEERSNYDVVKRTVWPDGTTHWTASRGQVFCDEEGKPARMIGVTLDVSKWKEAETKLIASEQLFRALVENSPDFIARYDRDYRRIYVNPAIQSLFKGSMKSVIDKTPADQSPIYTPQVYIEHLQRAIETATENVGEIPFRTAQGEMHWGQIRFVPEFDSDGKVSTVLTIGRDVHEIKENEQRFRMLAENFPDFIARFDRDGRHTYVNPAIENAFGISSEALASKTLQELAEYYGPNQVDELQTLIQRAFDEGTSNEFEIQWNTETGERIFEVRHVPEKDATGNVVSVLSIARDVTERKQAEAEHQAHLRFLESMDQVNRAIQGTNDLKQMMGDVLGIVLTIFDCDRAGLIYPCDPEATSWYVPMEKTRSEFPGAHILEGEISMDPGVAQKQRTMRALNGPVKFGPGSEYPLPTDVAQRFGFKSLLGMALYPKVGKPWELMLQQCSYERNWTPEEVRLFQEIGRRLSDSLSTMLSYRNLQESEERYRQLVDVSPDAIILYRQDRIEFINPSTLHLSGAKSKEDLIGRSALEFVQPDYREHVKNVLKNIQRTGEPTLFVEENFLRVDGVKIDVEVAIIPYQFQGENYIQIIARDITARKQHEREREAIIKVSTALRQARKRTEILNVILDQLVDLFDADGAVLALPDPKTEGYINEMGRGIVGEKMVGLHIPPGKGVCNWVITKEKPYLNNRAEQDAPFYRPELLGDSRCLVAAPLIAQEKALGSLLVVRQMEYIEQDLNLLAAIADIAANAIHRVTLHEQTEQQLQHLIALHQIDLAISSNFDLNITLNVLLRSVRDELEVDAASILLLNPIRHTLDYTAGIGFRTNNIERSRVRIGNGCAGHAAQELRTISCVEIGEGSGILVRSSLLASEEFVLHYATPLVTKGQIKGVLEVFHRQQMEPEQTWISYFETLATQAAIAIENTSLLENLQRSNTELTLAYDATIEGWSRALDLRDRETEGHTQRVAEMAWELAEKMGMSDTEKQDLRRGALLHDIGKMGVPDVILHKPGPLSEDEWEIMQQHPLYAYQMLAPIAYLKRALEIPYCHHEKWDGSGYPRGLKGDEIPLSARVFMVVDVFDALTSNRPYRKAWSYEKTYRYIQEQKGTYFDPRVTDAFLETRKHS